MPSEATMKVSVTTSMSTHMLVMSMSAYSKVRNGVSSREVDHTERIYMLSQS